MSIYEKILDIKLAMNQAKIKKSGFNAFGKYSYYELKDILPPLLKLCQEKKLLVKISFDKELATASAIDLEVSSGQHYTITMPMKELEIKGANTIQALGGTTTYLRRYLLITMFDLVEDDMFDGKKQVEQKTKIKDDFDTVKPHIISAKSQAEAPIVETKKSIIARIDFLIDKNRVDKNAFNTYLEANYKTADLYLLGIESLVEIEKAVKQVINKAKKDESESKS